MIYRLQGAFGRIRRFGFAYAWTRARLRLRGKGAATDYATWVALFDQPSSRRIARAIRALSERPLFSLWLPTWDADTVASVCAQPYPHWELLIPDAPVPDAPATATDPRIRRISGDALDAAWGDFIVPLTPGDILAPSALWRLAQNAAAPNDVLYSDEDRLINGVRTDPVFRPDYSPELLHDPAGLGGFLAWRRGVERLRPEAGAQALYDLTLRVAERARRIHHIPHILLHRPPPPAFPLWEGVLNEHLTRIGDDGRAVVAGPARVRVLRPLPNPPPKVSVLIPTRDGAALLERCVDGLRHGTDYPDMEILIIDNDSAAPDALRLLERLRQTPGVRVLPAPGVFNYAAMNNQAAAEARGEVLALLNNDIAVRAPGWLREMVAHAIRPDIGAVGAKLLYPNGTLQHAGVVTGIGDVAGHIHRGAPDTEQLRVRSVAAVTAACVVLKRELFLSVGGFDEAALPVSYNDVDLCLRLRARGLRIVFTPDAALDHYESLSRGDDKSPEHAARARREVAVMRQRWGADLMDDPYYSPNLSLQSEAGGLAFPPRANRRNLSGG